MKYLTLTIFVFSVLAFVELNKKSCLVDADQAWAQRATWISCEVEIKEGVWVHPSEAVIL